MTDIKMIDNRLPIINGDFQLVNGIDEIKQHIIVALNTFYTDWLLDYTKGIDYTKGLRNLDFLQHDCKSQILGVDGVTGLINFSLTFDKNTLTVNIISGVKTIYGRVDIAQTLQN